MSTRAGKIMYSSATTMVLFAHNTAILVLIVGKWIECGFPVTTGAYALLRPCCRHHRHGRGKRAANVVSQKLSLNALSQQWKLSEQSNDPSCLPDWVTPIKDQNLPQVGGEIEEEKETMIPTIIAARLTTESPTYTITNDSPLWIECCAQVSHPQLFSVRPVTGFLAPKGGTTNLCKETERYQDFCEFVVTFPPSRSSSLTTDTPDDAAILPCFWAGSRNRGQQMDYRACNFKEREKKEEEGSREKVTSSRDWAESHSQRRKQVAASS